MTPINPYAPHLGNRNPREVIAATTGNLEKLIGTLGPERASQPPAPGKWSPREIACHLHDCELAFAYRLRQALAEDHPDLQPFDQALGARNYAAYDLHAAQKTFDALRAWNVALINSLPATAYPPPLTHPELDGITP